MTGCFANGGNDSRMERQLNAHLDAESDGICPDCGCNLDSTGRCVECGWKARDPAYEAELRLMGR